MVLYYIPGIFEKCEKTQKTATAGSCPCAYVEDAPFWCMLFLYIVNFGSETKKKIPLK